MMGYLVKYKEKTSIFFMEKPGDNFTEMRQALLEQEKLADILQRPLTYMVISAYLVDMEQYRMNHPEENFEEL